VEFPGAPHTEDMCDERRQTHQLSVSHSTVPAEHQAEFLEAAGPLLQVMRALPRNVWAILLEGINPSHPNTFAFVSEWESATPRGYMHTEREDAEQELRVVMQQFDASCPPLVYGGPLWPDELQIFEMK